MAAKCTPVLRIPAIGIGIANRVQIMHKCSIEELGKVCETVFVFFFFLGPETVLRTSLVEASKLHFCLSLVLNNSSSEARGMCKDFCDSEKIYERK